jgi:DNA adenine methylase
MKLLPFRWYGGKYSHLNWLLPLLPEERQYVEPYGGSGAVLLNREPAQVETFNDIDSDITNFFKVLRENKSEFIEEIALTPYSREEFEKAVREKDNENLSDMEKARLFFVRAGQVQNGLAQSATPGRWSYCITMSRRDMSGNISSYYGKLKKLKKIAERLRRVQIENKPALDIIERYDDANTLFYCDPPYPHSSRGDPNSYAGNEMSDEEHRELAEVLKNCDGKVAISSYECDLMEELYSDWNKEREEEKKTHTGKASRQECLWMNYELD